MSKNRAKCLKKKISKKVINLIFFSTPQLLTNVMFSLISFFQIVLDSALYWGMINNVQDLLR